VTAALALALALAVVLGVLAWARSERLARRVDRLTRLSARDAAEVERLRRADQTVVERLPDPLLVLDARRAVLRANAAATAAFGAELGAVLRHPGLRAAIERAFASGAAESADLSLPVPVPREVRGTVVPLDPPLADGGQALVVLSDRTRERAVERMRADFVANASHELRTPLASVIGFIETLRGPAADDPPAQARFLGIMAEQAARMARLIDDLLSLSRIELAEHEAPSEPVALGPLLARVAAGFEPRLAHGDQAGATLSVTCPEGLPAVAADADQLAQVVQNLLENALKYGAWPDRPARITLRAAPAEGGDWPSRPGVEIAVRDEGPGIARAHLPRLTERFYRVDAGRSRAAGGTGLGLAIVKHIVNRHRGALRIESEEGAGTAVRVWLPTAGGREDGHGAG
jgi:two-component system phosphate regulon sensor histidine kinase PhoR